MWALSHILTTDGKITNESDPLAREDAQRQNKFSLWTMLWIAILRNAMLQYVTSTIQACLYSVDSKLFKLTSRQKLGHQGEVQSWI